MSSVPKNLITHPDRSVVIDHQIDHLFNVAFLISQVFDSPPSLIPPAHRTYMRCPSSHISQCNNHHIPQSSSMTLGSGARGWNFDSFARKIVSLEFCGCFFARPPRLLRFNSHREHESNIMLDPLLDFALAAAAG